MATLAPVLKHQFFDSNGDPLANGKLYSYLAGTSTPASTSTDSSGSTSNANPVILNSRGECSIWLGSGSFKFVLKDSNDSEIWSVDNVTAVGGSGGATEGTWVEHAVTDGQSATDLTGETVAVASYSSARYEYEIIRGTTVFSSGEIFMHYRNSAWYLVSGADSMDDSASAHGVTFSISGTTTGQLRAALDSGAGSGTIKLKRTLVPA